MGGSGAVAQGVEFGARPLDQAFQVVLGLAAQFDVGVACDLAGREQDREHGALVIDVNGDAFSVAASAGRKRPGCLEGVRVLFGLVDAREKRMTRNEALFREVNERVQDHAEEGGAAVYEYFCECANIDCTFRARLTSAQYEAVRADPKQFVVLPQHFTPEVEVLVAENDSYWIVRKTGEAGEFVEKVDPRSRTADGEFGDGND